MLWNTVIVPFGQIKIPLILVSMMLIFSTCSWMGPDEASLFSSGTVLNRSQTKTMLGQGIAINTQNCPANYAAGLYANQYVLASILNSSFYDKGSVEVCTFLLTLVPCDLNPNSATSPAIFTGIYATIIRNCGLKAKGVD